MSVYKLEISKEDMNKEYVLLNCSYCETKEAEFSMV